MGKREIAFKTFPWHENPFRAICDCIHDGDRFETDSPEIVDLGVATLMDKSFYYRRMVLTDREIAKLRTLGKLTESILYEFSAELHPEMPEIEIERVLRALYIETGIETPVIMVGSDERIMAHRNCVATTKGVKRYLMISLTSRRAGLHVSLTRFFHFGPISEELEEKHLKAATIFSSIAIGAISVSSLGQLYAMTETLYEGFRCDKELTNNPIGRITGYSSCNFPIAPDSTVPLLKPVALSLSPSLAGARSDDSFIIYPDGNTEFVTFWEDFPKKKIRIDNYRVQRPWILEL